MVADKDIGGSEGFDDLSSDKCFYLSLSDLTTLPSAY